MSTKHSSNNTAISLNFAVTPLPEFKKELGQDWIKWGADNLYSDHLIDLYLKSPRHGAIINGKVDYIIGGGLSFDKNSLSVEGQAIAENFIEFFKSNNCLGDIVRDGELYNGVAVEIIWNKKKTKPVQLIHIPFGRLRTNEDETKYYYSKNWKTRIQDEDTGFKEFDLFDANNPQDSQIFIYKIKAPVKNNQFNVYPTPNYQSGVIAIESDIAVGNFDNSNLNSNFTAGSIINFNNGVPATQAAKEEIERAVKSKGTGADNAGHVFISFNNGKDKETTVTTITPSDLDKQNIEVDKRVEQRLFTTHKITNPALFGIRQEGSLSGDNNLAKDFELFQSIYIDGRQKWHEEFINLMGFYFGVTTTIEFKRVAPIKESIPDAIVQKVYDVYSIEQLVDILGMPKVLKSESVQMKSEDPLDIFSKYGRKKELFEIIESKEFIYTNNDEVVISEFLFANELSSLEKSILDLISKDEKISIQGLSDALKEDTKKIQLIYNTLIENGLLKVDKNNIQTITESAAKILDGEKVKTKNYEVVYGYDWRVGFSNKDKKTSRDFCKDLMAKDLLYTRSEIDSMSNEMGTSVWNFKGGWYTKPDTNVHLPYCRHTWHQYLIKAK